MSIFKRSAMDLDATAIIKPKKLQEEGVPSKFGGLQDRWWIEVGGEDSTTYTGYYEEGRPDAFGQALRQAMEQGAVVTIIKGFTKEKNRAAYDYIVGEGKANSPASKAPENSTAQRSNGNDAYKIASTIKGYQIAYQGIGKFVGTPGATPAENHARIVEQFELMEKWAEERAKVCPATELIKAVEAANLGFLRANFEGWLANHYHQTALEELTEKEIVHAIINLPKTLEKFHGEQSAAEEVERDQNIIAEPEIPEDQPPF